MSKTYKMSSEEDLSSSKKMKRISEMEVLHERLNDALRQNKELIKALNDMRNEFDKQIEELRNENGALRSQLDKYVKMEAEGAFDESLESEGEDDEMESEVVESVPTSNVNDVTEREEARPKVAGNSKSKEKSKPSVIEVGDSGNKRKSKSVPIFTTYGVNIKSIISSINDKLGHSNYNIKILSKNVANIKVCTLEDYDKMKGLLEEQKVHFFTYTPKSLRPFSIVIGGLSGCFEAQEILEYLGGLQIDIKVINLTKLGGNTWLLKLTRDSDIRKFYEVRYILHCRVNIRKFYRKGVTQCFNCQRFGHVALNCRMPYRCVKCAESHGPAKCAIPPKGDNNQETLHTDPVTGQITKVVGLPVKCANCGVEGHAASSKECPRRIELIRKMEERKMTGGRLSARQTSSSNGAVVKGVSYAAAAKTALIGRQQGSELQARELSGSARAVGDQGLTLGTAMAQYELIDRDCGRFFGGGLLECLRKVGGFAREYRNLGSDEEKSRALLGMLIALGNNG